MANTVHFAIPPGVNKEFLDPPIPQSIDLSKRGAFDETGLGPWLLKRHWDYLHGHFDPSPGTLFAAIRVVQSSKEITSTGSLQAAEIELNELQRASEFLHGGKVGKDFYAPIRFDPVTIAGHAGLFVHYRTSMPDYIVPLDKHHYLIFVITNEVTESAWRTNAQAAADAIVSSFQID